MATVDLILGDCLEKMRAMPDGSVDAVITDPAYESMLRWQGMGTTARMGMGKKGSGSDDLKHKFFQCIPNDDLPDLVRECHRVLKNERHAYFMCDWETLKLLHTFAIAEGVFAPVGYGGLFEPCKPLILDWTNQDEINESVISRIADYLKSYTETDFIREDYAEGKNSFRHDAIALLEYIGAVTDGANCDPLVWDKVIAGVGYTYRPAYEFILMLWKGKKRMLNDRSVQDVLRYKKPWGNDRIFPTQKPVELMEVLISQSTQMGENVLDPFMGSGTTGVACVKLSRNFIGIEINHDYFKIAERRITEAQAQLVLPLSTSER